METPNFDAIVSDYSGWIRKTLHGLGVEPCDLDDVMQEVLRGVARGLPVFEPPATPASDGAVTSWLFAICHRQAANLRRTRSRRAEALRENLELDGIAGCSPSPEATILACERRARLRAVLDDLSPDRRAIIVAHELEGMAMSEVAVRLGIPVNTAWNRLRLARAAIREAFRRQDRES